MDVSSADGARAVEELSYTEASAELDGIVHFFEQRDVDVDQLVGRLVRATAIIEELDRRLRRTRTQVDQLVPRLAAVLSDDGPPATDDEPEDRAAARRGAPRGAAGLAQGDVDRSAAGGPVGDGDGAGGPSGSALF
jgi:exodeoxyribonuclease VII small subunit